jgi:hypothetical protein
MLRFARFHVTGGLFHVISRFHDRRFYLDIEGAREKYLELWAYLGLEACPPWLATEAVFGPDEKEHESIRHELALYVDEGRSEGRRPELSGEVSREFARRVRKMMGGDVALSYPVLGPDSFIMSALKEQVHRHNSRQVGRTGELGVERIIERVFVAMGLDPNLARKRIKPGNVARARALVARLWVEKMGRPQVVAAEGLGVRPTAVAKMLTKLRQAGLSQEEEQIIDDVLGSLTDDNGDGDPGGTAKAPTGNVQPTVIVLKRQRK